MFFIAKFGILFKKIYILCLREVQGPQPRNELSKIWCGIQYNLFYIFIYYLKRLNKK